MIDPNTNRTGDLAEAPTAEGLDLHGQLQAGALAFAILEARTNEVIAVLERLRAAMERACKTLADEPAVGNPAAGEHAATVEPRAVEAREPPAVDAPSLDHAHARYDEPPEQRIVVTTEAGARTDFAPDRDDGNERAAHTPLPQDRLSPVAGPREASAARAGESADRNVEESPGNAARAERGGAIGRDDDRRGPAAEPLGAAETFEARADRANRVQDATRAVATTGPLPTRERSAAGPRRQDDERGPRGVQAVVGREQEAERFASILEARLGAPRDSAGGAPRETIEAEVKASLERAGVDTGRFPDNDGHESIVALTLRKLRALAERSLDDREEVDAAGQNDGRSALPRDRRGGGSTRQEPGAGAGGEFVGGAEAIFKAAQMRSTEDDVRRAQGDIPAMQLDQLKKTADQIGRFYLAYMKARRTGAIARFGPNRG